MDSLHIGIFEFVLLSQFNDHKLVVVKNAGDGGVISKSSADHAVSIVDARGVLWKESLTGRKDAASKDAPLTSVRVSADDKIHSEF